MVRPPSWIFTVWKTIFGNSRFGIGGFQIPAVVLKTLLVWLVSSRPVVEYSWFRTPELRRRAKCRHLSESRLVKSGQICPKCPPVSTYFRNGIWGVKINMVSSMDMFFLLWLSAKQRICNVKMRAVKFWWERGRKCSTRSALPVLWKEREGDGEKDIGPRTKNEHANSGLK